MDAFTVDIHARWPDMDQNGHMRTTAYLEVAEDCRMRYFAAHGFPLHELVAQRVGPVVQRDELTYRRELRLLEPATVRLEVAGLSPDGARFRLRNTIVRGDGEVAATVTSTGGWLDLDARRLTPPPTALAELIASLRRSEDYEDLSPLNGRAPDPARA